MSLAGLVGQALRTARKLHVGGNCTIVRTTAGIVDPKTDTAVGGTTATIGPIPCAVRAPAFDAPLEPGMLREAIRDVTVAAIDCAGFVPAPGDRVTISEGAGRVLAVEVVQPGAVALSYTLRTQLGG
ncbi:MAG TPA: hypothetical protein VEA99_09840 [Gemmatimonadaceae bacterium]|nr:hypothetical protein [Gemmatimonadaceae bacterium]